MDRRRAAGLLLALAACVAYATAAPTASNHTSLDLYDGSPEGCYYNFQHYGEGDRIMTNEPCLNCTCHNRMLMCYLRVCPFTKPIGQDCTIEKRADQCCPIVTCPDVPVDLLTSTTTSPAEYGSTGLGKLDKYGCSIHGKFIPEGAKVPAAPNKPCEHCYCIRNMTTCVMQECTLHVDGCTPIYHKDVCCPVRYSCDHPEDEMPLLDDLSTTVRPTPGFLLTTTTLSPVTQMSQDCLYENQIVADGALIKTEKACDHCYCMKGDIVCVVQECGTPMENEGKNCTALAPREGVCCPDTYICEGDEPTPGPEGLDYTTELQQEKLTTLAPPRRAGSEGSGYRNEPDDIPITESPFDFETEGSGEEQATIHPTFVTEGLPDSHNVDLSDETSSSTEEPHEFIPISTIEPVPERAELTTIGDINVDTVEQHGTSTTNAITSHVSDESTTVKALDEDIGSGEEEIVTSHEMTPTSSVLPGKEASEPTVSSEQSIATTEYNKEDINVKETTTNKPTMEIEEETNTSNVPNIATDISVEKTTKTPSVYDEDTLNTERDSSRTTTSIPTIEKDERKPTKTEVQDSTASYETESKKPLDPQHSTISTSAPGFEDEIATESPDIEEGTSADFEPNRHITVTASTPLLEEIEKDTTEQEYIPDESTPDKQMTSTTSADISIKETIDKESLKPDMIDENILTNIPTTELSLENEDVATTEAQRGSETDTEESLEPQQYSPTASHEFSEQEIKKTTQSDFVSTFEPQRGQETYVDEESDKYSPTVTKAPVYEDDMYKTTQSVSQTTTYSADKDINKELSSGTPQQHNEITTAEPDKGLNTIPSGGVEEEITESPEKAEDKLSEESTTEHDDKFDDEINDVTEISKATTSLSETSASSEDQVTPTTEPTIQVDIRKTTTVAPEIATVLGENTKETFSTLYDHSSTTESSSLEHQETDTPEEVAITKNEEQTTGSKESSHTSDYSSTTQATELDSTPEKHETFTSSPSYEIIPETTSANLEENEIINEPRIPGEGDCLLNGVTYRNESSIASTNKCQSGCRCVSSIIKCDPIICSEPPAYMENCQTTYDSPDSCCPTYVCDHKTETMPPQSHSQVSGTEAPLLYPVKCHGDECVINEEQIPTSELCESGKCSGQDDTSSSHPPNVPIPEQPVVDGHEECTGDKCTPINQLCNDENGCQALPVKPCEGNECGIISEPISPHKLQPCADGEDCSIPVKECNGEECVHVSGTSEEKPHDIEKECTEKSCRRDDQQVPQICSGSECRPTELTLDLGLTTPSSAVPTQKESDLETETKVEVTTFKTMEQSDVASETSKPHEYETNSEGTSTKLSGETSTEPSILISTQQQNDIEITTIKLIDETGPESPKPHDTQPLSTTESSDTFESEKITTKVSQESMTATPVSDYLEPQTQLPVSEKSESQLTSETTTPRSEKEEPSLSTDSHLEKTTPQPETETKLTTESINIQDTKSTETTIIKEITTETEEQSESTQGPVKETEAHMVVELTTPGPKDEVNLTDKPVEEEKETEAPITHDFVTAEPIDEVKYTEKPAQVEKETKNPLVHDSITEAPEDEYKYTDKPEKENKDTQPSESPEEDITITDEPLEEEKETQAPLIHDRITTAPEDDIKYTGKPVEEEKETEAPVSHDIITSMLEDEDKYTDKPVKQEVETETPESHGLSTAAPEDEVKYTSKPVEEDMVTEAPVSHDITTSMPEDDDKYTDKPTEQEVETETPESHGLSTAAPEDEVKYTNKPVEEEKVTEPPVSHDIITSMPEDEDKYTDKPTEQEVETETPESHGLSTAVPEDVVKYTDKPVEVEKETEAPVSNDLMTSMPEDEVKYTDKPAEQEKETEVPMIHEIVTGAPEDEVKDTVKPAEYENKMKEPSVHDLITEAPENEVKYTDKPTEDEVVTEIPVSHHHVTATPEDELKYTDKPVEIEKETEAPVSHDLSSIAPDDIVEYTEKPVEEEKDTESPENHGLITAAPEDEVKHTDKPIEEEKATEAPVGHDLITSIPEDEVKYTDKPLEGEKATEAPVGHDLITSIPEDEVKYTDKPLEEDKQTEAPVSHDLAAPEDGVKYTYKPLEEEKQTEAPVSQDLITAAPEVEVKYTNKPVEEEKVTEAPISYDIITSMPEDEDKYTDKPTEQEVDTETPESHGLSTAVPEDDVKYTDKPVEVEKETEAPVSNDLMTAMPEDEIKYTDKPAQQEKETEVPTIHEIVTGAPEDEVKDTVKPAEYENKTEEPSVHDLITATPEDEVKYTDKPVEEEVVTVTPVSHHHVTATPEDELKYTDKPIEEEKETEAPVSHDLSSIAPDGALEYTEKPVEEEKDTESPENHDLITTAPEDEVKHTDKPIEEEKATEAPVGHDLITSIPEDEVKYTDKPLDEDKETDAPVSHDLITAAPEDGLKYTYKPLEEEKQTEAPVSHDLITAAPEDEVKYTYKPSEDEKETEAPVIPDFVTAAPKEEVKYTDMPSEVDSETEVHSVQLITGAPEDEVKFTDKPVEENKETATTIHDSFEKEQTTPSIKISEAITESSDTFTDKSTESSTTIDIMKTEIPFKTTPKESENESPVTHEIPIESSTISRRDGAEDVGTEAPEIEDQSSTDSHKSSPEIPTETHTEGIEVKITTKIPSVTEADIMYVPVSEADQQITKDTEINTPHEADLTPSQPTATESVQDITIDLEENNKVQLTDTTSEAVESSTKYGDIENLPDSENIPEQEVFESTTIAKLDVEHVSPTDKEITEIPILVTDQQTAEVTTESQPAQIDTTTKHDATIGEEEDSIPSKTSRPEISETTKSPVEDLSEKSTAVPEEPIAPVETMLTSISPQLSEEEQPTTSVSKTPEVEVQTEKVDTSAEKQPDIPSETPAPQEETAPYQPTTAKAEEVSTLSPVYDKITKPASKPTEASITELPKPIPTEEQPTDDLHTPEEDASVPQSGASGYGQEPDYVDEDPTFGPGTCRYGGKVYVSAQQIPRDDPCDFCFCFRSDIICLQQSCPPPIHGCHEEPIQGFCCPRYECPVSMATTVNVTTTTTTTTTTLPPHFPIHSYKGSAQKRGCLIKGHTYKVGEVVRASSGPCLHCTCGGDGQMKCDPKQCTPEPMLRQMIAAAVSAKRRR